MKDLGELFGQGLLSLQVLHGSVRRAGERLQQAAQGVLCRHTRASETNTEQHRLPSADATVSNLTPDPNSPPQPHGFQNRNTAAAAAAGRFKELRTAGFHCWAVRDGPGTFRSLLRIGLGSSNSPSA